MRENITLVCTNVTWLLPSSDWFSSTCPLFHYVMIMKEKSVLDHICMSLQQWCNMLQWNFHIHDPNFWNSVYGDVILEVITCLTFMPSRTTTCFCLG